MSEFAIEPSPRHRILVVEDEAEICALVSDILEDAGLGADCVQTDRAAYERLRHDGPFACMLVDVNLGSGTTGYDVARYARQIDRGLPIIFISGQTSRLSLDANGVPGAVFVEKPFTPDELVASVRVLIGHNDD